jgi:hypothetical protein
LELAPNDYWTFVWLASAYAMKGMTNPRRAAATLLKDLINVYRSRF